jgi:homeobox-leucine zipper protein
MHYCTSVRSDLCVEVEVDADMTNFMELLQMNVDLWVKSPRAPNRNVKFLRVSKQIQNSQWVVVDVSMDGIRGIEPDGSRIGYLSCRLLPSGCLLRDMSNGLCEVLYYH